MKTAISVPDAIYERIERVLASTGQNRSAFFTEAATRRLDELEQGDVTARIDMVVAAARDALIVEYNQDRLRVTASEW